MIKHFFILWVCILALSTYAYAQEEIDHSSHQNMENGDHSDHNETDGPMQHDMDHSMHDDDGMDHSDMTHGDDHLMDMPGEHEALHSSQDEHAGHHGDHHHHHDDGHVMDHEGGMIMGQNFDELPSSCNSISEEIEITVRGGRKYAEKFPGTIYAFDQQEWRVKPCSKITWHFINEDEIRHQFMMHGLPRYLYNQGMFHLESTGPRKISGTMIVPADDDTYLVHCDISQHMEKGMKAQLVVGNGGEDIPSIPGLTPYVVNDQYEAEQLPQASDAEDDSEPVTQQITDFYNDNVPFSPIALIGLVFGLLCALLFSRIIALRKKDTPEAT